MPETDTDPDLFDSIVERLGEGTADRLDRRMREATEVKTQEEASSQRRLEEMWVREHARQQATADARAEKLRQERMLISIVLIAIVIVILIVILLSAVLGQFGAEIALGRWLPLTVANA